MLDRRIVNLVERTLKGAGSDRWLSVSPYLPDLAEAAPETFLKALEDKPSACQMSRSPRFSPRREGAALRW